MKNLEFECKTITPMFLTGADKHTPELRPPSIKSLMRFWWRAINGHLPVEELKKTEAEIFGASDKKIGRSKIILRVESDNELEKGNNIKNDYKLKSDYNFYKKRLEGDDAGTAYLLYSTVLSYGISYIKDNQEFTVELKSRFPDALKQAAASFWALVYLGGIGTRARRGGGNVVITDVKDQDSILSGMNIDFLIKGKQSDEMAEWLIENYTKVKLIVNRNKETKFISNYSNLSISRFIISNNSFCGWIEALNDIGNSYAGFRSKHKRDIFGTATFGLPRNHIRTNNKDVNRRSSPLIFKILKVENKYYWMVLRLAGEFLPENVVLKDKITSQKPAYQIFDEFWNGLKTRGKEKLLSQPDKLNKVKAKIENELSPEKIILFGSKARGDFYEKSDIDIAVETDENIELAEIDGAVDIVNLRRVDKTLKVKIKKEGIEL
jgi:CRISPR-associated protein Cmr1